MSPPVDVCEVILTQEKRHVLPKLLYTDKCQSKPYLDPVCVSKSDWERMQKRVTKNEREEKERKARIAERKRFYKRSKDLTKDWSDLISNVRKKRLRDREERLRKREELQKELDKEEAEYRKQYHDAVVERARKLLFNKSEKVNYLNGVYLYCQCSKENKLEAEFQEFKKENEKKMLSEHYKECVENDKRMKKQIEEEKAEEKKKMKQLAEELALQVEEKRQRALEERAHDLLEKEELIKVGMFEDEMKKAEELKKHERKLKTKKDLCEEMRLRKAFLKYEDEMDKLEDKKINAFVEEKKKLRKKLEEETKKAKKARNEHLEKVKDEARLLEIKQKQINDDEEKRKKVIAEREALRDEKLKKEEEKKKEDLIKTKEFIKTQLEENARYREYLEQENVADRNRREEDFKLYLEQRKKKQQDKREFALELEEFYKKQMNENTQKKIEEKQDLVNHQMYLSSIENYRDEEVAKYGKELIQIAKEKEWPDLPLEKASHLLAKRDNDPFYNFRGRLKLFPQPPPSASFENRFHSSTYKNLGFLWPTKFDESQ